MGQLHHPSKHNIQEKEVSEEDNPNYVEGEEINLLQDGKKLFVATYSHCNICTTVHHKPVTKSCGRFLIKEVLSACQEWPSYDNDFHVVNAYILWPYKYTKKCSVHSMIDTHAKSVTLLKEKKRKRNPQAWQKNRKKLSMKVWLSTAKNLMGKKTE